jgi:hypothetical protein
MKNSLSQWEKFTTATKPIATIKFYADLKGLYNNRLFSFDCEAFHNAKGILDTFKRAGNRIRTLYLTSNRPIFIYDKLIIDLQYKIERKDGLFLMPYFETTTERTVLMPNSKESYLF